MLGGDQSRMNSLRPRCVRIYFVLVPFVTEIKGICLGSGIGSLEDAYEASVAFRKGVGDMERSIMAISAVYTKTTGRDIEGCPPYLYPVY